MRALRIPPALLMVMAHLTQLVAPCMAIAEENSPFRPLPAARKPPASLKRAAQAGQKPAAPAAPAPSSAPTMPAQTPAPGPAAPPVPAPLPAAAQLGAKEGVRYSFEFSKAEIQDVVKAISDMVQQNFIIPERVKGQRITILSPGKVTAAEAYQVFYTALATNGINVVRVGKFYKLVDSKDAIRDTVPTCIGEDAQGDCALGREQMVTALLRLRFVDAGQVSQVVRSLLSKDGDINTFAPSNAIIVSEYSPNLRRLRRIIDALDVSGLDDALQIVQIQYASATEVAEKLTQIFDVGSQGQRPSGPSRRLPSAHGGNASSASSSSSDESEVQISKIVPDDRTNQIIIKANRRSFDAIMHLIHKIDVPISEAEHGRVHVYYLENAKAEDLAGTLSSLTSGLVPKGKAGSPPPGVPAPPRQANEAASLFEGDVKITADKATNAILVMCSAHDYRAVRAIIEKLDVSRRQVYVEAAILEVKLQDQTQVGLDYHAPKKWEGTGDLAGSVGFFQSAFSAKAQSTPSPTFSALIDLNSFMQATGGALGGILGKPLSLNIGTNNQLINVPSFGAVLRWLATTSNANVLSTPHLLTTDNQEAQIQVGETVPFNSGLGGNAGALGALAGAAGGAGGAGGLGLGGLGLAALSNSVQRIPVLLTLKLTPQINESNRVRLDLDQQIEDITGSDERSQTPSTSKRSIKTTVVVDDQQTIVLGGLIKDSTTTSDSKIPFLGDLPLLGFLFKQHSVKKAKTNLMLILTPYIINSSSDFQRIFERKMREHEEFADEYYGHHKEYRAHLDYHKKAGPLGRMVATLRKEHQKLENGGIGDGSETLIQPRRRRAANAEPDAPHDAPRDAASAPQAAPVRAELPDIPEVPEPSAPIAPPPAPEPAFEAPVSP